MEKIGYGLSITSLRLLVHDLLMGAQRANPNRITGLENFNQMLSTSWVTQFCNRHDLSLRKSSVISKGHAVVPPSDLSRWFQDIDTFPGNRTDLKMAMANPKRVFNFDETAMDFGVGSCIQEASLYCLKLNP